MNYDLLAKRLQAWLAPEDLLGAARVLREKEAEALKPASLVLASPLLRPERDGGLRRMVQEFLSRFVVPSELIGLLKNVVPAEINDLDLQSVAELRFEGSVEIPNLSDQIPGATVEVRDRSVFLDVVAQPLKGLQGLVATCSKTWTSFTTAGLQPQNVFHQHRASEPFVVWVDSEVGRASGFPDLGKRLPRGVFTGPNYRYRAVTISDFRQGNSKLLEVIRRSAVDQALSTWGPIR